MIRRALVFFNLLLGVCNAGSAPLQIDTMSLPDGQAGQPYATQLSGSGFNPQTYQWTIGGLPPGLDYNSQTGAIAGIPTVPGTYVLSVTLRSFYFFNNNQSQSQTAQANLTLVIIGGLRITTLELPQGFTGRVYSGLVEATGGTLPYVLTTSNLPPGLTMTEGGVISGAPTSNGTYRVDFTVTDKTGATARRNIPIIVITLLSIVTNSPLPNGTVNVPYSQFITAIGGSPIYIFRQSEGTLPPGLSLLTTGSFLGTPTQAGTFNFVVRVTDSVNTIETKAFRMTVVDRAVSLNVDPGSLRFSARTGAEDPPPQDLRVTSDPSTGFTVQADDGRGGAPPSWLRFTPGAGTTPGYVRVSVSAERQSVGTFTARLRFSSGGGAPVDVTVTLDVVAGQPSLTVSPTILTLRARASTPAALEGIITVRNIGGGTTPPVLASALNRSPWILSVIVQSGSPQRVRISINPAGLAARTYRDVIRISSSLGNLDVPLLLIVYPAGPSIGLSQTGLRFVPRQGPATTETQSVRVLNLGDPQSPLIWRARTIRGADLLTLAPTQGSSAAAADLVVGLTPAASAAPGIRTALIEVTQQGEERSPQYIIVEIDTASPTGPPTLNPSPGGLFFTGDAQGAAPGSQTISVRTNAAGVTPFTFAAIADDGGTWLSATSTATTAAQGQPGSISVTVNQRTLANPGFYTGQVTILLGGVLRAVNIGFLVGPSPSADPAVKLAADRNATCAPGSVVVLQNGSASNFSVPAGWPATLSVIVRDNCNAALPQANVVANFGNGDPPITLIPDATGQFSGTWSPGRTGTQVAVKVQANYSTLNPGEAIINGEVSGNSAPPPTLVEGGLIHNYNGDIAAPLAPGTVGQVFGDYLSQSTIIAPSFPLSTSMGGLELLIGGISAPLYYVSKTQLSVQVPVELTPNKPPYAVLAYSSGLPSNIQYLSVTTATPGALALNNVSLVAQHANGTLVSNASPARPDETLVIYLVGMGPTNPVVASGAVSPSNPLAVVTSQPTVTVDGQNANVTFAGLTPSYVGLYQINFQVPSNARTGSLSVDVSQDGNKANTTQLIVSQ